MISWEVSVWLVYCIFIIVYAYYLLSYCFLITIMTICRNKKVYFNKIKSHRGVMYDCKCVGCGFSSPLGEMLYNLLIFSFFHFGNKAKSGVEFHRSTRDAAKIVRKMKLTCRLGNLNYFHFVVLATRSSAALSCVTRHACNMKLSKYKMYLCR